MKTGGRKKGTPNKVTGDMREWLAGFLYANREQLEDDFTKLKPIERVYAFTKLAGYILPKLQTSTVEVQVEAEYKQLQKMLTEAPEEATTRIAEKLLELQAERDQQEMQ